MTAVLPRRLFVGMFDIPRSSAASRRAVIYGGVIAFYLLLFAAVIWPVYPRFATLEPRILGVPHSLAWVVGALLASFFMLLALYAWERRSR